MARQEVEVTIVGARGLKRVAWFGVNQPVAVAWVNPREAKSTRVAVDGGATPIWNQRLLLPVDDHLTRSVAWLLKVQVTHRPRCPLLLCSCCLHRPIGTASIPVDRILAASAASSSAAPPSPLPLLSFPLLGTLNRPHGLLDLTLRLLPASPSSHSSPLVSISPPSSSFSSASSSMPEEEPPRTSVRIPPTTHDQSLAPSASPAPPPPPPPPPPLPPPLVGLPISTAPHTIQLADTNPTLATPSPPVPFPTPPTRKPPPPLPNSCKPIPTAPPEVIPAVPRSKQDDAPSVADQTHRHQQVEEFPSSIATNYRDNGKNAAGDGKWNSVRVTLDDETPSRRRRKHTPVGGDEWHDSFYDPQHLYPTYTHLDPYHDDEEMAAIDYLFMESYENVKDYMRGKTTIP